VRKPLAAPLLVARLESLRNFAVGSTRCADYTITPTKRGCVRSLPILIFSLCSILLPGATGQVLLSQAARSAPLRVGILGPVHGHVDGFFQGSLNNPDIQLVGVAEPDQQLSLNCANRYGVDPSCSFQAWSRCCKRLTRKPCSFTPTPMTTGVWLRFVRVTGFT